jgi:hypothetical protein
MGIGSRLKALHRAANQRLGCGGSSICRFEC